MSKYVIDNTTLTNIGDAIREKTSTSSLLMPEDMPEAIRSIEGGGSAEYSPWQKFVEPNVGGSNTTGSYDYANGADAPTELLTSMNLSTGAIYGGADAQGTLFLMYKTRSASYENESGAIVTELNGWKYIGSSFANFTNYTSPLTQEIMFFTRQWKNSDLDTMSRLQVTLPKLMQSSYHSSGTLCYYSICSAAYASGIQWIRQINNQVWASGTNPQTGSTLYMLPSMVGIAASYEYITRRLANRPIIVVNQGYGGARSSTVHWVAVPATNYYTPIDIEDTTQDNTTLKNYVPPVVADLNRNNTRDSYFQMACLYDMSGITAAPGSTSWRLGYTGNPTEKYNSSSISFFYFIPAQLSQVPDPADLGFGASVLTTASAKKARKKVIDIEEEPEYYIPGNYTLSEPTEEEMLP